MMTESIGQNLFGDSIPWGRWPWTMHSAFWGMFLNLLVAIPISADYTRLQEIVIIDKNTMTS